MGALPQQVEAFLRLQGTLRCATELHPKRHREPRPTDIDVSILFWVFHNPVTRATVLSNVDGSASIDTCKSLTSTQDASFRPAGDAGTHSVVRPSAGQPGLRRRQPRMLREEVEPEPLAWPGSRAARTVWTPFRPCV